MTAIEPFLTAYDPSDLPGGSVDPLGFERGYACLADKILPGLTNVANRPRYFAMLCAGSVLADRARGDVDSPRTRHEWRLKCIQRLERFWAVANVVAARKGGDGDADLSGLRGVRYVQAHLARLAERRRTSTSAEFRLLSRQVAYGAVGIYGTVADELRLLDRSTLATTPDLGAHLGEEFIRATRMPKQVRDAACSERATDVSLQQLRDWGVRAHISAPAGDSEGKRLVEALEQHPVRARIARRIRVRRPRQGEEELVWLGRIGAAIGQGKEDRDLREAIDAILAFENCYRNALLIFHRLLGGCQHSASWSVDLAEACNDAAQSKAVKRLPSAVRRFDECLARATTDAFTRDLQRLNDVRSFLKELAAASNASAACEMVLRRHKDVQRAKLDGGRPKMPWLEISKGRVTPTLARALQMDRPPDSPEEVVPHAYRMRSALALLEAEGEA